ncbi:MAG: protein kinase [Planctomycetes bacterium]|nr:protein kinase [Planctomycetota bacterium]
MLVEAVLGTLVGLGVQEVYKLARGIAERWAGRKSELDVLDEIAGGIHGMRQDLAGADEKNAAAAELAVRSLALAEARLSRALLSQPALTQVHVADAAVREVFDKAASEVERDGPARAGGEPVPVDLPRPPEDLTGTELGGYRLEKHLGTGGFGTVYLGRNAVGQRVAVKVVHHASQARRVLKEGAALVGLSHPGIVELKHVDPAHPEHPYLVFEYVEGETLRKILSQRGPLGEAEVLHVLPQVLDALAHAHSKGVLHLDLKPDNLIVAGDPGTGTVKILDFGLGRLAASAARSLSLSRALSCQSPGGTLDYMAPEQQELEEDLDERADLYALGVTVFELLRGRIPRGRANLNAESPALNRFFEKAYEFDKADRLASAMEGLALLAGPRTRRRARAKASSRDSGAVPDRRPAEPIREIESVGKADGKGQSLSGRTGAITSVAFSPDGNRLASGSYDKTVCLWSV